MNNGSLILRSFEAHWRAPKFLVELKRVQLCQIAEVVWNLVPLPASSTKGGERGVLKVPGLD
jgi:hypothetical protein